MLAKIYNDKTYTDLDIYNVTLSEVAKNTYDVIDNADMLEELDTFLAGQYPDGISESKVDALLGYDSNWIYYELGIDNNAE